MITFGQLGPQLWEGTTAQPAVFTVREPPSPALRSTDEKWVAHLPAVSFQPQPVVIVIHACSGTCPDVKFQSTVTSWPTKMLSGVTLTCIVHDGAWGGSDGGAFGGGGDVGGGGGGFDGGCGGVTGDGVGGSGGGVGEDLQTHAEVPTPHSYCPIGLKST